MAACGSSEKAPKLQSGFSIMVLGNAQDAGFPQHLCFKECCKEAHQNKELERYPSCIALLDHSNSKFWLFDCTPAVKEQLALLEHRFSGYELAGIFLTHAHIGHYLGLAQFGREVVGANGIRVYCMPRMATFLQENGPWSQLVNLENINLNLLENEKAIDLDGYVSIRPFLVPHRDEFSETVGFSIRSESKSAIYIPDIDKWERWDKSLTVEVNKVDLAFLDATFYNQEELPGRDMTQIPHPFVVESMKLLNDLSSRDKAKVHFIHFNHSNPLINKKSNSELSELLSNGFDIAKQGRIYTF